MRAVKVLGLGVLTLALGLMVEPALAAADKGDPVKGRGVHMANCMACHGREGGGDGPAARALRPPPRAWNTAEFWAEMTPERGRAAIRTGAPGTAMMGFPQLTEPDVVNLLAYMDTLRPAAP